MIENIVAILVICCFVGVFVFGMLAASQVDSSKIGSLSKGDIRAFGPLVSEKVLKPTGLKWARMRNICILLVFGAAILWAVLR